MQDQKKKTMRRMGCKYSGMMTNRLVLVLLLAFACSILASPDHLFANESSLWKALDDGSHFALIRHALAPGTGDPPQFEIGKCSTQRNLSAEGRSQAVSIGQRFRAHGIKTARVFSSQWCRCLDTAKLMALGTVEQLPVLNSFFRRYEREEAQTQALKQWLRAQDLKTPVVLVTHQVNITALTGVYPASGEMVIVGRSASGKFSVVGAVAMD